MLPYSAYIDGLKMSEQMKNNSESQTSKPVLCSTGCGFWGNPLNMNLCSKCYKDFLAAKEKECQRADTVMETASVHEQVNESEEQREAMDMDDAVQPNTSCAPESIAAPAVPTTISEESPQVAQTGAEELNKIEDEAKAIIASCASPPTVCEGVCVRIASDDEEKERKIQKNKSRCMACNKKIGLTGFKCKCGYFFCSTHRYSDSHNCDFDYKAAGRAEIAKANPLVVADKVERI